MPEYATAYETAGGSGLVSPYEVALTQTEIVSKPHLASCSYTGSLFTKTACGLLIRISLHVATQCHVVYPFAMIKM